MKVIKSIGIGALLVIGLSAFVELFIHMLHGADNPAYVVCDMAGLAVSLITAVAATLISLKEKRELEKAQSDQEQAKIAVATLLTQLETVESVETAFHEAASQTFDTVTLNDSDYEDMCVQGDRVHKYIRGALVVYESHIEQLRQIHVYVFKNAALLPTACVSLTMQMLDQHSVLSRHAALVSDAMNAQSWLNVQMQNKSSDDPQKREECRLELYNKTVAMHAAFSALYDEFDKLSLLYTTLRDILA